MEEKPGYRYLLAQLVSGSIGLGDFSETIDKMLFDLRQTPTETPEKHDLSTIQLYLHEISEGLRGQFELYMLAHSMLDRQVLRRGFLSDGEIPVLG